MNKEKFLYKHVSDKIKIIRNLSGLTQEQFGKLFDLSRESIINIEKLRHRPSLHLLYDISNKFEFNVNFFFKGINFPEQKEYDFKRKLKKYNLDDSTIEKINKFIKENL